eukprot:1137061-Pelagomonas_calceolata.AAC.3
MKLAHASSCPPHSLHRERAYASSRPALHSSTLVHVLSPAYTPAEPDSPHRMTAVVNGLYLMMGRALERLQYLVMGRALERLQVRVMYLVMQLMYLKEPPVPGSGHLIGCRKKRASRPWAHTLD